MFVLTDGCIDVFTYLLKWFPAAVIQALSITPKGRFPGPSVQVYLDCGTCGPSGLVGGAAGAPCCIWLSRPPPWPPPRGGAGVPGTVGPLWPPWMIDVGARLTPARIESARLVTKNKPARTAVARVSRLPV